MSNTLINYRSISNPADSKQEARGFEEQALPLLDSLYNFARWISHSSHDAEDLVQETFLKGLRNFHTFEPGTNFRAWMFTILRNTFLSSCSSLNRRMTVPIEDEMEPESDGASVSPDVILEKLADSQSVQNAIYELPTHSREILILRDMEELNYREISEVLSIPLGTVMSRLSRARKALRASLLTTDRPRKAKQCKREIDTLNVPRCTSKTCLPQSPEMAVAIWILLMGPQ